MPRTTRGRPDEKNLNKQASFGKPEQADAHGILGSSSRSTSREPTSTSTKDKWSSRKSLHFTSSKLSLVKNPVQTEPRKEPDLENIPEHEASRSRGDGSGEKNSSPDRLEDSDGEDGESISFYRRETVSMAELFYDLWFVANLNVFATVHPITELSTLASFIEYFILLWTTWFVTTVFDARYGHDGVFERLAHAFHLAVMVGFAIAGVSFSENKLIQPIFRTTSLFLMMSRLVLGIQYGLVLFHARHHRRSRYSLILATALHLLPAIAYLVIAFVSSKNPDRELFFIWVALGLMEMGAVILHSTFSKTLSFEGTHFNERLSLLTLIILGEGIIILTKNISKIVEYSFIKLPVYDWSPALIGVIICSAATLYITFQLYFDWMHSHNIMKATQQAYWAIIHLPFHIALFLLSEGGSQWDLWWRAIESFRLARSHLEAAVDARIQESEETSFILDGLKDKAYEILDRYGADVDDGGAIARTLDEAFSSLGKIPDGFWGRSLMNESDPNYDNYVSGSATVLSTAIKAISDAFEISVEVQAPKDASQSGQNLASQAVENTGQRLLLVLVYMFVSAGLVLILLMLMHILSKRRGWSLFNVFRTAIVVAVGLGLCLVSLVATNPAVAARYLQTPWQIPAITISYFLVLILTHLPHPPRVFIKRSETEEQHLPEAEPEPAPTLRRRRPSHHIYGQERLSQVAFKQSLAIRRGITTMKAIRVERPHGDPVAERSSPKECHLRRRVADEQGYSFEPPSTPFNARRRGLVIGA